MTSDQVTAELKDAVERGSAFARTLGPTVVSIGDGEAVLRVDAPESLHNHVGGPHAATLFGFAETAAAGVVVSVFADLIALGAVPLIKSAEISYSAIAVGPVTATARFAGEAAGVRASYSERGVAVFPVTIEVSTVDGTRTALMTAQMALKRF